MKKNVTSIWSSEWSNNKALFDTTGSYKTADKLKIESIMKKPITKESNIPKKFVNQYNRILLLI